MTHFNGTIIVIFNYVMARDVMCLREHTTARLRGLVIVCVCVCAGVGAGAGEGTCACAGVSAGVGAVRVCVGVCIQVS